MPQVLAVSGFQLDKRAYPVNAVISISSLETIAWLKGRKLVEDDASAVSAAISGGAAQYVHPDLVPTSASANYLTALFFGDSLADNGFANSGESTTGQNWLLAADMELGGVLQHVVNGGVSGERTSAMLERLPKLLSLHLPDVLVIGPCSVNDIDPAKGVIFTGDQTVANYERFLDMGFACDTVKTIILSKPHRPSSTLIATISAAGNAVRSWYKTVCDWMDLKSRLDSRIKIIPFGDYATNSAGTALRTNYSLTAGDPTHLGYLGARQVGNDAVKPILSQFQYVPFNMPRNMTDHANMLGPASMLTGSFNSGAGGVTFGTGITGTSCPGGFTVRRMTGDSTATGANVQSISSPIGLDAQCAQMDFTLGAVGGGIGFQLGASFDYTTARLNSTAYTWGAKVAVPGNADLCCHLFTPGTSAASAPDFSSVTEGAFVQDGSVVWQIGRIPKVGDNVVVEIDMSITALTGGACPMAWVNFVDNLSNQTARYINYAGASSLGWPTATGRRLLRRRFKVPAGSGGSSIKTIAVFAGVQGANGATGTVQLHGMSIRKV